MPAVLAPPSGAWLTVTPPSGQIVIVQPEGPTEITVSAIGLRGADGRDGAPIDDDNIASNTTWSSAKITTTPIDGGTFT